MDSATDELPHVAVCPGAGIGHLVPFLRLASMLANANTCSVTLVIIRPTISTAETTQIDTFLATHTHINYYEFNALPYNTSDTTIDDPFLLQYDAITRSAELLADSLNAFSPRPSAVFSDFFLASGIHKPLAEFGIPSYTLNTPSVRFFSLIVSLSNKPITRGEDVVIPVLALILADELPPIMYKPDHAFARLLITNAAHLTYAKGILVNTFEQLEGDTLSALHAGEVFKDLPPVFPIGPLHRLEMEKGSSIVSWLDDQPINSVVFVSFGSRSAMSKDQIKEIGEGLEKSGMRFLCVIKTTIVDKEDKEELSNLLGETFFEKTINRGLILKEWVNQDEVLAHPSIGGFLSHCGWNSVIESAQQGVPLLAWPLGGDQRVNAALVRDTGLGIWERRWGREGEGLITADEITKKIKELMTSDELSVSVKRIADEAKKAWEIDGSSSKMFKRITDMFVETPTN